MGCVPSKTKPLPAVVESQSTEQSESDLLSEYHDLESDLKVKNFREKVAKVEDTFQKRRNTQPKQQSGSLTLSVNSGITVQVIPAVTNTFNVENKSVCGIHNEQFQHWCGICKVPVCGSCVRTKHLNRNSNNHIIFDLSASRTQVAEELKFEVNRLTELLHELRFLQKEALEWKQKDLEMAKQFDISKQKTFKKTEDIGQEINKAERILIRWKSNENVDCATPISIYDATCEVKNCIQHLNSTSKDLADELEGYRTTLTYTIHVNQKLQTSTSQEQTSSKFQTNKALENFLIADVFRTNYQFQKEKFECDGTMTIDVKFENTELEKTKMNSDTSSKEFKNNLQKYLNNVTQFNASYKAQQLCKLFPIRINNVNMVTDAAMDLALTSDQMSATMPGFLAYLIGNNAKTTEWHFIADNIPSYLMGKCQEELQKEITQALIHSDLDASWNKYKRLNRFIGELYVCGLLPAALIEYFLDFLLSKKNQFPQYAECVCILLLTIGPICEAAERKISLDGYLQQLSKRLLQQPNKFITHLIQHIQDMRINNWNLKDCSGISTVTNQQTDIILEYLNSIETAVISNRSRGYKSQIKKHDDSETDDWNDLLYSYEK